MPKPSGLAEPPIRRVLAIDPGSRCIRLLLLESRFGKLRVLRQDALDLREEGLVAADELKAHLQVTLADWGRPPLTLALPQQVAVSQLIELPPVPDAEARALIQAETIKLAGANESALVSDFTRVASPAENRQSFWVTFCQESEIQSRIAQLGLDDEEFREITTAASALITAWQAAQPARRHAVIAHAGAQSTTIVVIHDGVGVFASSFPMAGDFFTRAIVRLRQCSAEAAEALKRSTNLLSGETKLPGFAEIVDGWAGELNRQLADWRTQHPGTASEIAANGFIATGGTFDQPGLLEYLEIRSGLKFHRWPTAGDDALQPGIGFEIALGAALQSLGHSAQPVSLMPANRRSAWKRRLGRQRLEFANALLLAICFIVLAFGIWGKLALIQRKQALANKVQAGLETVSANGALTTDLLNGYDTLRPLFERHQTTVDTLQSLALLQQARSNRSLWCVLLADQQSYFAHSAPPAPTNRTSIASLESDRRREITNASPARPGLIAELCVPDDPSVARSTLTLVVNSLKRAPLFSRVDLLSEDLRRNIADPKVLLPERHFALALDFATTDFQPAPRRKGYTTGPRPLRSPQASNTSTNL
jgi:Tfp pilus assembly PilM family ATPase